MAVAPNDLFLLQAFGTCFNQRIMLTHWYYVGSVPGTAFEAQAANDLIDQVRAGGGGDQWETDYRNVLPPDYVLNEWRCQKVAPVRYRVQRQTRNVAGLHADSTEATNQAATISFTTLLAGRDQIATKHIGPIPQGAAVQVNGEVNGAYKTLLGTLAFEMLQPIVGPVTGAVFIPCIAHKTPFGSFTQIVQHQEGDTLRTMRRRTVRVGE